MEPLINILKDTNKEEQLSHKLLYSLPLIIFLNS